MPVSRGRARLAAAALVAALAALAGLLGAAGGDAAAGTRDQANVVIVLTDDQDAKSLRVMKGVKRKLGRRGANFRSAFAVYPLCCPSRATILTGQYPHNHGVLDNAGRDGGVKAFDESTTLATALSDDGYRTGYIGKYLNGYPALARDDAEAAHPPGWDRFFGMVDAGQYEWSINANGTLRRYGREPNDYQTDVLRRMGLDFIRKHSGRNKPPFFMMLGTNAPHGEKGRRFADRNPRPAKRHVGAFERLRLPDIPSFNEADVSDKPPFLRVPRIKGKGRRELRDRYRGRLESLLSVDQLVTRLLSELRRQGELRNTLFVFTSDNGFLLGEHRLERKRLLYEESAQVPLVMRGPGIPKGVKRHELVGNIDLAPTIYDVTGVSPPPALEPDGVSLLNLVDNPGAFADRDLLLENFHIGSGDGVGKAVRTQEAVLIEQRVDGTTYRELYDLDPESPFPKPGGYDPYQLENQYENPDYSGLRGQLQDRLDQLRNCEGNQCR
jgi:N-acetylglucosamine-6-sulfatase